MNAEQRTAIINTVATSENQGIQTFKQKCRYWEGTHTSYSWEEFTGEIIKESKCYYFFRVSRKQYTGFNPPGNGEVKHTEDDDYFYFKRKKDSIEFCHSVDEKVSSTERTDCPIIDEVASEEIMETKVEKNSENYLQPKDAAKMIRKELKNEFGGTYEGLRFSVTTSLASMTSSVDIKWTDGPTETEVKAIVDKYEGATFDPQQDLSTPTDIVVDGRTMWGGPKFVCVERQLTHSFLSSVTQKVCEREHFSYKPVIHEATEYHGAYLQRDTNEHEERVNREIMDAVNLYTPDTIWEYAKETLDDIDEFYNPTETEETPMEHTDEEAIDEAEKLVKLINEAKREARLMMKKTKSELVIDAQANGIDTDGADKSQMVAAMISDGYGQEIASEVNKMIATKKATTAKKKALKGKIDKKHEQVIEALEAQGAVKTIDITTEDTTEQVEAIESAVQEAVDKPATWTGLNLPLKVEDEVEASLKANEPETVEELIERVDDLCNGNGDHTDEVEVTEERTIEERVNDGEVINIMELVDRSKEAQGAAQLDAANEMLNEELAKAINEEDSVFEKVDLQATVIEYTIEQRVTIQTHLRSPNLKSFNQVVEICGGNVNEITQVIRKAYDDSHHEQRAKDARVAIAIGDLRDFTKIDPDTEILNPLDRYLDQIERWHVELYTSPSDDVSADEGIETDDTETTPHSDDETPKATPVEKVTEKVEKPKATKKLGEREKTKQTLVEILDDSTAKVKVGNDGIITLHANVDGEVAKIEALIKAIGERFEREATYHGGSDPAKSKKGFAFIHFSLAGDNPTANQILAKVNPKAFYQTFPENPRFQS